MFDDTSNPRDKICSTLKNVGNSHRVSPWRTECPRKALRGGISKSILSRVCQFLSMRAHKMAPRTSQWLKERASDTPTKGLLWLLEVRLLPALEVGRQQARIVSQRVAVQPPHPTPVITMITFGEWALTPWTKTVKGCLHVHHARPLECYPSCGIGAINAFLDPFDGQQARIVSQRVAVHPPQYETTLHTKYSQL